MFNFSMSKVCLRKGLKRKKTCFYLGLSGLGLFVFLQMTQFDDGYTPLRPLSDAKSEARRLLKYITHYHYHCNSTTQTFNRSHWPICTEHDAGIDLESRNAKIAYTVGYPRDDFVVERDLALNHSFRVFIVSHDNIVDAMKHINNTYVIKSVLVANDPADFTRNSYGQQTLNDVMLQLKHTRIDLLRLIHTGGNAQMWEVLKFLVNDNVLLNVHQLHVAMYIDKLDEDWLYNWYRVLYDLFYKEGFRLYHTASSDSLCIQVTMMQSCIYYMSFIRNPGATVFVLHPPADYGSADLEEERLLDYINRPQVECKQEVVGGPNDHNLQFTTARQPQWQLCSSGLYQLFKKPCSVFRFRLQNDHVLEQKFIGEGCSVHTLEPVHRTDLPVRLFRMHSHHPEGRKSHMGEIHTLDDIFASLRRHGDISLIEVDFPGQEWDILTQILDSGILQNTTQVVALVQLADDVRGRHPTVLRSRYSELRRMESQGFRIFHSSHVDNAVVDRGSSWRQRLDPDCCFRLGFIKSDNRVR